MIYTFAEWTATILESVILFVFLAATLSYKTHAPIPQIAGTLLFCIIQCAVVFIFNYFYLFEGALIFINVLIYIAFCCIFLQHNFWYQCIVVLLAFSCLFCINSAVAVLASSITGLTSTEVFALRNPVRIFLLFITKVMFVFALTLFSSFFRKKKLLFHPMQCILMAFIFLITFIVGVVLQRIQVQNNVASWESTVIVACLISINCLLFFILVQFTVQNKIRMNHALLKVQMENEQRKLQDSIRWSMELETLRHDLKNHLFCISEYIKNQNQQDALQYIERIAGRVQRDIPHYILTEHPALNAILDLKRMECEEHEIDLKCFIMEKMPAFNEVDLCIVLSNLLDNAIEAEQKEQEKEIRLSISTLGNYLHITVQNMISRSVLRSNKPLKTSKANTKLHGFGIRSVTETVQKNDGMMDFYEEDGWFVADIMVKLNNKLIRR